MDFFDTSVLIAAFLGDHPEHLESRRRLAAAEVSHSCCAAHTLAEVYSVTTRLPIRPPIVPEQAWLYVQQIPERLQLITLEAEDYAAVLRELSERGIGGGRTYDALLLQCARKAAATTVYTWNVVDFSRLAPDLADRIRTP